MPGNLMVVENPAETSLTELFEAHHERVFRAAYRITGIAADAEDVLQVVFTRLVRSTSNGAEADELMRDPERYLSRAAVNAALDVLRLRRRAVVVDIDAVRESDELGEQAPGVDAEAERDELGRALRAALTRIDPKAAEMVALKYFEGFGNGEIAAALGTTAGTVGVTLHRARRRLKDELTRAFSVPGCGTP